MSDGGLERKSCSENRNGISIKLITDARFLKLAKRQMVFTTAASAVREPAVDLHRTFAT